jgi:hypothetical protein
MCGARVVATVVLPYGEEHEMAGIDDAYATGFLPFDNSGLRARLAEMPVRTTSIEAELRAVMAERHESELTTGKAKRRSRWD